MMTPIEKHYWDISQVYLAHYEKHMERERKIMIAKGVTAEMTSDLVEWRQKNKPNERWQKQWDRLLLLEDALDIFGSLSSTNIQIKIFLSALHKQIDGLQEENTELKKQIDVLTKTIEHEQ
jgi:hypothetical protein